ncbi:MAG: M20/M25/M40 family metallo-hydrolase [Planctomycetota bacterium]
MKSAGEVGPRLVQFFGALGLCLALSFAACAPQSCEHCNLLLEQSAARRGYLNADGSFDRNAARGATLGHLKRFVALDTQNPPGNEGLLADELAHVLAGLPGVEIHVLPVEEDPARANFVARLRAERPTARPVLVLAHMDVVGAQPENWSTPPFTPTMKAGFLHGRGVIDDKGMLAAMVTAFSALSQQRGELARDIILLATAGEEGGPPVGVDRVLEQHRDLLSGSAADGAPPSATGLAEFALNEGGRVRLVDGRVHTVNIQTTEKLAYNVTVSAAGPSGHGSVPLPENALAALARAVERVHAWRAPVRLNDTTRRFFAGLAAIEADPAVRADMQAVGGAPNAGAPSAEALAAAERLADGNVLFNAVLRSGASLTRLNGGIRDNVIPSSGTANFNLRVVPGDDVLALVAAMEAAGGEPSVHFALVGEPRESPPVSPVETALFRALERAARELAPDVAVMPFMSTGATDGAALRAVGIPTYGILPFPLELQDELRMHGDDERVSLDALGFGTELVYRTLLYAAQDRGV